MRQLSLFKSKRQRGEKAPSAFEFATHCMVADTLRRWGSDDWRWSHFPAGEFRSKATAGRLKRMGVNRGWPDFILINAGRIFFLELKRHGQTLSEPQRDFRDFCERSGCTYEVADCFDDALLVLKSWGAVRTNITVQ